MSNPTGTKEWYTQAEIAEMLGVELRKLYPRVNALRSGGFIQWKVDPSDQRSILIHVSSIDAIRKAMRLEQ
jgi:DNA-binding MarR family transcriptional regulator